MFVGRTPRSPSWQCEMSLTATLPSLAFLYLWSWAQRSSLYLRSSDSLLPLASPIALTTGVILFCTPAGAAVTCFALWVLALGVGRSEMNTSRLPSLLKLSLYCLIQMVFICHLVLLLGPHPLGLASSCVCISDLNKWNKRFQSRLCLAFHLVAVGSGPRYLTALWQDLIYLGGIF